MDKKEEHLKACADFIRWADDFTEKIYQPGLRDQLARLVRDLRELRDTEYYFESGERDLDRLYNRYLPYLKVIFNEYAAMQESNDYEKIQRLAVRLRPMLENVDTAVREITKILPQDEIDEAEARAKAEKIKAELDAVSKRQ
jgi:hypothetical protein